MAQVLERAAEAAYRDGDIEPIRDELRSIANVCRRSGPEVHVVYTVADAVMKTRAHAAAVSGGGLFTTNEEVTAALNVVEQDPDPWSMGGYPVRWTAAVDQVLNVRNTTNIANSWARSVHVHAIERAALARNRSTPTVVRVLPLVMVAIFVTLTLVSLLVNPKLLMYSMFGMPMLVMAAGNTMMGGPGARSRRVYGDIGPVRRMVGRAVGRRRPVPERNRLVLQAISQAESSSDSNPLPTSRLAVERKPAPDPDSFVRVQVWARGAHADVKLNAGTPLAELARLLQQSLAWTAPAPADRAFLNEDGVTWEIGLRDSRDPLPQGKTLAELAIGDGSVLNLVHGAARTAVSGSTVDIDALVASGHRFLVMSRATFGRTLRRNPNVHIADFGFLIGKLEGQGDRAVADLFKHWSGRHIALTCGDTWRWSEESLFADGYTREVIDALLRLAPADAGVTLTGPVSAIQRMLAACEAEEYFTVVPDGIGKNAVWQPGPAPAIPSARPELHEPWSHSAAARTMFRLPDPSDPLYLHATEEWLSAEKAWNSNARLRSNMYDVVRDATPIEHPDRNVVRDMFPLTATGLDARVDAVRAGLQTLDEAWLAYLVNAEEAFLTMPRLRDDDWPATKRYRKAMAALGEAIEAASLDVDEGSVSAAESALHDAEDAWHDARLAAADAGTASLPEREQRALRRAAHHIQVLEDPNLPKAMRDERLRQLRAELDRLDTVPISFEQVMTMPQLETVRRLALEAAPATDDPKETN